MDRQEQEKQEEREDMATIRMKRGIQSDIETMPLLSGEMAVALDTGRVFVGTEEGNIPMMGDGGDMDTSIYDPQKKQQDIFAYIDQKRSTRTARFVVGTATAGWTKDDCDYLCDGTDDQEEIMAAIAALPASGGEILILDGTYHITASIYIRKDNITIRGNGFSTILQTCFAGSKREGAIHCVANHCTFTYFAMDGNKENYEDSSCFTSDPLSGGTLPEYILLDHLYIHDAGVYGMEIYMNKAIVTNCDLLRCKWGVICQGGSKGQKDVIVSNNRIVGIAQDDDVDVSDSECSGIHITISSDGIASNNIVKNCSWGIHAWGTRCICTGNVLQNNVCGILINNGEDSIIMGNYCGRDNKIYSGNQSGTIRIESDATNSVIMGNRCLGKAPTVTGATGNLIENNLTS